MGKIIVTQEQADRINYFRKDDEGKGDAIRYHINKWLAPVNTCLNELSVDELVRALYVGYEVEFEDGDWLINTHNGMIFQIEDGRKDNLKDIVGAKHLRYATESEIVEEEN